MQAGNWVDATFQQVIVISKYGSATTSTSQNEEDKKGFQIVYHLPFLPLLFSKLQSINLLI
jgi:hypothetical protein